MTSEKETQALLELFTILKYYKGTDINYLNLKKLKKENINNILELLNKNTNIKFNFSLYEFRKHLRQLLKLIPSGYLELNLQNEKLYKISKLITNSGFRTKFYFHCRTDHQEIEVHINYLSINLIFNYNDFKLECSNLNSLSDSPESYKLKKFISINYDFNSSIKSENNINYLEDLLSKKGQLKYKLYIKGGY